MQAANQLWRSRFAGLSVQMVVKFLTRPSLFCVAAISLAAAQFIAAPVSRAETTQQAAGEMLQDGLDALGDREADLATQLFEQVILGYPGTPEADRAERELGTLGADRDKAQKNGASTEARQPIVKEEPSIASVGHGASSALRMRFAVEAGDRVFFAEDSAVIGGRARVLIESQARWLNARTNASITVVGRADDGGSAEDEQKLSAKRAEVVRDKLIASGVPADKITIEARGKSDPIATCSTTLCQAQNRHAESVLSITPIREDKLGDVSDLPQAGVRGGATPVNRLTGSTVSR